MRRLLAARGRRRAAAQRQQQLHRRVGPQQPSLRGRRRVTRWARVLEAAARGFSSWEGHAGWQAAWREPASCRVLSRQGGVCGPAFTMCLLWRVRGVHGARLPWAAPERKKERSTPLGRTCCRASTAGLLAVAAPSCGAQRAKLARPPNAWPALQPVRTAHSHSPLASGLPKGPCPQLARSPTPYGPPWEDAIPFGDVPRG